jgi:N-acyl-D-amino-acid deacylase
MFRPVLIAKTLGEQPPADQDMIIRYMLGQKLDFDPGTRYAYSNFGYCLLGRVIEQVSGEKYELYVKHHLLAPLGIKDMRLGRTREKDRAETEVTYFAPGSAKSVFTEDLGQPVPWPYGGWNLEAMDSHGGWIAAAADLVRFAQSFDDGASQHLLDSDSIRICFARPDGMPGWRDGKPLAAYYGCGWQVRPVGTSGKMNTWHTGLLDGTSTLLVRRYDGLTWAVLFNTARRGDKDTPVSNLIDPLLHKAADEVKDWPEEDLFPTIGPR